MSALDLLGLAEVVKGGRVASLLIAKGREDQHQVWDVEGGLGTA